jgi:hypothetical protein
VVVTKILAPIVSLRELKKETCSVTKKSNAWWGDEKPAPIDIWEGGMDLVNMNVFTHNH